jgi:hypothetical protein
MRQCGSRNKSGKGHQIGVLQFEKSNPLWPKMYNKMLLNQWNPNVKAKKRTKRPTGTSNNEDSAFLS